MNTTYIKTFLYGFVIDLGYVFWMISVQHDQRILAAVASICVAAPSIFGYIEISKNKKLAIPYFIGLFVGTLVSMTYGHLLLKGEI